MRSRKNQLSEIINMKDPQAIFAEAQQIITAIAPDYNGAHLKSVFHDVEKLFRGEYSGYRGSSSRYHDFLSTAGCFLSAARILHGAALAGNKYSAEEIGIILVGSLMNDAGFFLHEKDKLELNKLSTDDYIKRTVKFIKLYVKGKPFLHNSGKKFEKILLSSAEYSKDEVTKLSDTFAEMPAKVLYAANLLGRLADRYYLERLIFLYHEFKKANIACFNSEKDLLIHAVDYYESVRQKLYTDMKDINHYLENHFRQRCGIEGNLYLISIEKSINYLQLILHHLENEFNGYLRRNVPTG